MVHLYRKDELDVDLASLLVREGLASKSPIMDEPGTLKNFILHCVSNLSCELNTCMIKQNCLHVCKLMPESVKKLQQAVKD